MKFKNLHTICSFLILLGNNGALLPQDEPETKKKPVQIDVTHEIATDFIWRGQSFSGDFLARRNNLPYKEITESYIYNPTLRVGHETGLFFELEGNLSLQNRNDRDSDQRFQAYPGGGAVDTNLLNQRLANGNFLPDSSGNSVFLDIPNNVVSEKCNPNSPESNGVSTCSVNPWEIKTYRERNGKSRKDGLFTTFAYEMDTEKFGIFTMGTWWYVQNDRNAKYAWNEFFLWWELPFLQEALRPTIQTFTQTSFDVGGGYGNQYSSFSISHIFFSEKIIQMEFSSSVGYQYVNNNTSQKSGIKDITSGIRFLYKDIFLSFNHTHRPDIYLYDNNVYFPVSSSNPNAIFNFSERDGRTVDPSRLYGLENEIVYNWINQQIAPEIFKSIAKSSYQSQSIPRNLFWVSVGYQQKF